MDVLSGSRREEGGECAVLVNCAAECVEASGTDVGKINFCLRRKCAFHCFDGSCPKCAGFVTRIFNQVCVSGDLRARVLNFEVGAAGRPDPLQGHCYEMFRDIVHQKFAKEFADSGLEPSIGSRPRQRP